MPRRVLFFTRKFPPSVGGMETLADGVWRTLRGACPDAILIAHGGSNRALPLWLPHALAQLIRRVLCREVGFVLAGDALAYAVITPWLRLLRVQHATMIMGLDVTYENRLYRAVVHPLLRRAPRVLAISSATAERAVKFGVPRERVSVVQLGVSAPAVSRDDRLAAQTELRARLGLSREDVVLLTLGRLVRRKGARWFVANVLPRLPRSVHYVLAGDGPEAEEITRAAGDAGIAGRVQLLGRVSDEDRELLMRGADVFVQPNIAVPGDMEGFGLVTIEAALRGTPVVAADLEGIKDAVADGSTGILLPSEDAGAWIARLTNLIAQPESLVDLGARFQGAAADRYGEEAMGAALADALALRAAGRPVTPVQ